MTDTHRYVTLDSEVEYRTEDAASQTGRRFRAGTVNADEYRRYDGP